MADKSKIDEIEKTTVDETDQAYDPDYDIEAASPEAPTEKESKKKITSKTRRANPDSLTEEELEYIYQRRRALPDTSPEKRKYYREADDVAVYGDEQATSQKDEEKNEAQILIAAASSTQGTILKGRVVGCEFTKNDRMPLMSVELENSKGYNEIMIPLQHFCFYDPKEYEDDKGTAKLNSLMESYLGATVRFVVFEYIEKEKKAIASRLAAMTMLSRTYYDVIDKRIKRHRIEEGSTVSAPIVATFRDRIIVDVCGVDCTIKTRELDWTHAKPANEKFSVGETVRVKVMGIGDAEDVTIQNRTYRKRKVEVSRRELLKNPADLYYDKFRVGQKVMGVITTENSASGIFVSLQGKMDILCETCPGNPAKGSSCIVTIIAKDDEKKWIKGRISPSSIRLPKTTL